MTGARKEGAQGPQSRIARFSGLPKKITAILKKESDRGAILIIAAYLEEILSLIVRDTAATEKLADALVDFRAPAGDFSSKITLCEAFSLISSDEAKALNALRKIRNAAAHFEEKGRGFDVLFDSAQTVSQVRGFLSHLNLTITGDQAADVRDAFQTASRLLATKLYFRLVTTHRRAPLKSLKEYANERRESMKGTPLGEVVAEAEREAREGNPKKLFSMLSTMGDLIKARAKEIQGVKKEAVTKPAKGES